MGQSWVIWTIWSPHSSFMSGHLDKETKGDQNSRSSVQKCTGSLSHQGSPLDISIVMANLHCCMAETKTTLQSNYPSILKKATS